MLFVHKGSQYPWSLQSGQGLLSSLHPSSVFFWSNGFSKSYILPLSYISRMQPSKPLKFMFSSFSVFSTPPIWSGPKPFKYLRFKQTKRLSGPLFKRGVNRATSLLYPTPPPHLSPTRPNPHHSINYFLNLKPISKHSTRLPRDDI